MELTEYKEVTKTEKVTTGYKCDECGKIHSGNNMPDDWHKFNGHHNSWGNDSCDSYVYYMACSPECYAKLLKKAVEEFEDYYDAEIDDFDIEFAKKMSAFLNAL